MLSNKMLEDDEWNTYLSNSFTYDFTYDTYDFPYDTHAYPYSFTRSYSTCVYISFHAHALVACVIPHSCLAGEFSWPDQNQNKKKKTNKKKNQKQAKPATTTALTT